LIRTRPCAAKRGCMKSPNRGAFGSTEDMNEVVARTLNPGGSV
jgi:hypothetical protein